MNKEINIANGAFFSLFIVSYTPLFFILIFRQIINYKDFLNWGGFNWEAFCNYITYFGFVTILILSIIFSIIGIKIFLKNIDNRAINSGETIFIVEIENKNSESITYLFTYIIPFIFQDLSKITDIVPIIILLTVTYCIYINSNLVLINPILNIKYNLYDIRYTNTASTKHKKGLILIKEYVDEHDSIKIKKIGKRLIYGKKIK